MHEYTSPSVRDNIKLGCTEPTLNVVLSLLHRTMRHQCKNKRIFRIKIRDFRSSNFWENEFKRHIFATKPKKDS